MIWLAAFWLIAAVSIQGPLGALCWAVFSGPRRDRDLPNHQSREEVTWTHNRQFSGRWPTGPGGSADGQLAQAVDKIQILIQGLCAFREDEYAEFSAVLTECRRRLYKAETRTPDTGEFPREEVT